MFVTRVLKNYLLNQNIKNNNNNNNKLTNKINFNIYQINNVVCVNKELMN